MDTAPPLTRLGSYRLLEKLGAGAMGTVYLSEDEDEDRRVAVKVLHPHLLERKGFFKRFQREARAGGQVDHPNVVRTLDCDFQMVDGAPHCFLVMEYVEGRTLRELLQELGQVPEALLREIARQVAAGLEAIHARGIIHRDLKPENVLISRDHQIRIMDLGIAKLHEASVAITTERQFAGSLLYAAPEQLRHERVGPASDLYALGVVLYELATGVNPFRYEDPGGVVRSHLEEVPAHAADLAPELSPFLPEVLTTLLEKDPADRFASAAEVASVLDQAERSSWWVDRQRLLRARGSGLPRIPVRKETKLQGRETELEVLRQAWDEAQRGHGNTVFFEGEAGIGKTRLVAEFLQGIDAEAHVLYGSYPPSGGLGGFSDAILGHFGEDNLEQRLAPYLTVTPLLVPAFAALVKHDTEPEDAQPIQGDALNAVGVQLMRAMAAEKATVWVFEDLHFAPKERRDLALSFARAAEGHRVLLVFTARPGVPSDELQHFDRLESLRRANLARLGAREVVELLQDAFRSEALAEKLGAKIALKSDGVPFFIFEMIRGLKEGQFITQLPDGSYVETKVIEKIQVPSAVKDLVEARLGGLSDEERTILDIGAVLGFEFDPDLVATVREATRVGVLEKLAAIERRSGVVRAAGRRYNFDHHQIQELLYTDLPETLREEYHFLAARAFAARQGVTGKDAQVVSGEINFFLAHHHLNGSCPEEARPYLIPALTYLLHSYRNEAVIELAADALRPPNLLEVEDRVAVLVRQAQCLDLLGRRAEQRAALGEARRLADETGSEALRAQVCTSLGNHLSSISQYDDAHANLREALRLARAARDKRQEAKATGNLGMVLVHLGQFAEAQEHLEHALTLSREIGSRRLEAAATGNLGLVCNNLGRFAQAKEHYERHRALSREIGYRLGEAIATGNLGLILHSLGRYTEAREHHERHCTLSREIGYREGEALAIGNLGLTLRALGRISEAQEHFERERALSREIGHRDSETRATMSLGSVLEDLGRYAEAKEHYERCSALSREIGNRHGEAVASGNLGRIFLGLGRYPEAREYYERFRALNREIGDPWGEGVALTLFASLAEAEQDAEGARRLHEEALALLRGLGMKPEVAETLVGLARAEAAQNATESAGARLDEALTLAREIQAPGTILAATVEQARLSGGGAMAAMAAMAALEEHEERANHVERMNARFRLWELTRDKAHLQEAHRLLTFMRDHAPLDCRTSMIENVALHRDIMRAWDKHERSRG